MHWQTARFRIDLSQPQVMGIVNATPDSFSDGGRYREADAARARCDALVAEGAHILDIGGESTRPGSQPPSAAEEMDRVLPVVAHAVTLGVPVSVDTSSPAVMREALRLGADIVNDVRALLRPGAVGMVAEHASAGVCLMHMQGEPETMQQDPRYGNVVAEVMAFLRTRVKACLDAGIAAERIVLDPGMGFGKRFEHNLELARRQRELLALGHPLLLGWSRKGMLGKITGREVQDRTVASVAAALSAVAQGARIVRVHDVGPTRDALAVWAALGPPG